MKLLGIRFCYVGSDLQAVDFSKTLLNLGIGTKEIFAKNMEGIDALDDDNFAGAIFDVKETENWVEIWKELPGVPKGVMLQLIVDDADAYAENARKNGLKPEGPVDAHGERIYYLIGLSGVPISFQSKVIA